MVVCSEEKLWMREKIRNKKNMYYEGEKSVRGENPKLENTLNG